MAGARWGIISGAAGNTPGLRLSDCDVAVVIGRRDRYHHAGAVDYDRSRRAAGLSSLLIEFAGGHRLDGESLAAAVRLLEQRQQGK
jgi:hypothetical protein